MRRLAPIIAVFALCAQNASADIYECNGVVTNKPCDDGKVIAVEKPYEAPDPQKVDAQKKFTWMQNLGSAQASAKNKYDLNVNIDTVRDICNSEPLQSCREAVSTKEREINELITAKISADAAKKVTEVPQVPGNNTTINIIDDSDDALIGHPFGKTPRPDHKFDKKLPDSSPKYPDYLQVQPDRNTRPTKPDRGHR